MISPSKRLQKIATTIPTITMIPPTDMPPIPPPRRSGVATRLSSVSDARAVSRAGEEEGYDDELQPPETAEVARRIESDL